MDAPECRDLPTPHWPSLPKLEPAAGGGAYYALGEALRTQPAGIRGAADAAAYSYCLAHQLEPSAAAYVNLGTALWQGGRADAARIALNRALRFHPTGTSAAVAYRNLALAAPPPTGSHCSPPPPQRRRTWRRTTSRTARRRGASVAPPTRGCLWPAPSHCSPRRLRRVTRWARRLCSSTAPPRRRRRSPALRVP